ncbi:MAG: VOC family protein [Tepidiformaceae bacterium]
MLVTSIDHVVVPVSSLVDAARPYEALGLALTPNAAHRGIGTENRVFFVGEGDDFYVELLGIRDRDEAERAGRELYLERMDTGIARLMLEVADIAAAVCSLGGQGVATEVSEVRGADGRKICDVAPIDQVSVLGFALGLVQYPESQTERHARRVAAGRFAHRFPLKRLDHLAAITPDLEGATSFWTDVLGVPVFGEVRGPGMIIRQMKVGDAIFELLGPDGLESRLHSRPAGFASMCAFEVADLDAAVASARALGFSPNDPASGILPGTRVATIPAGELSSVGMQLLEYV